MMQRMHSSFIDTIIFSTISELINGLYSDCIDRLDDGFISSDIVDIIIALHKNICTIFKLEPIQNNKSNNILQDNYYTIMRKYTFRKCKNIHNYNPFAKTYKYDNNYINVNNIICDTSISSQRIKALSIELPTLKKESYLNFGESGIRFYLIDKTKCKMRVLLIGSNDTPYENGCFLFDIYIPPEYKNKPPTIRLINNPSTINSIYCVINFVFNPTKSHFIIVLINSIAISIPSSIITFTSTNVNLFINNLYN